MILLTLLGFVVVGWTVLELGMTTLTVQGAGPLTSRVMQMIWTLCLKLFGRSPRRHTIFAMVGPLLLVLTALTWYVGIWLGWWLIFLGSSDAIVNSSTNEPASAVETLYFAGYTVTTLGLGDFKPSGPGWQFLTAICAANGLLALTLSVTYLVPILSAAVEKRQLALTLHGIGGTPAGILRHAYDGTGFSRLDSVLGSVASQIVGVGQQHLAYPALHYFHSTDSAAALPVRLAAFSEAIDLIASTTPEDKKPNALEIRRCQEAIRSFLASLRTGHIRMADAEPPLPDRDAISQMAIPVTVAEYAQDEAGKIDRRLLHSLVLSDGWRWEDVGSSPPRQPAS